ncbi:hypothetical protein F2Q69_00006343 [Brassica cretica]|uniref:Uncharacterized protein n=1 Tax=Brassica cretica TaxID=69181 RepID=A0A8S9P2F6_BRACR|nr:hypothetical protein F2Q69_00006343 [Brassica cretica]
MPQRVGNHRVKRRWDVSHALNPRSSEYQVVHVDSFGIYIENDFPDGLIDLSAESYERSDLAI